ncbi:MAG: hypothetical protein ACFFD8_04635 [Candidatus Thorarchaeota archaeon]
MKESRIRIRPTAEQNKRSFCYVTLFVVLSAILILLIIENILLAAIFGTFYFLFIVYLMVPRDRVPKDLERIRRDLNRRTHFPAGAYGKGLLHLEDGGPTKKDRKDEQY